MGAIRDKANVVYADGPASAPSQPPKQGARELNGLIEDSITGAAAGMIRATTLAGLGSGTRVGQPGQVTDGANKGEYAWSGGAWVRTGDLIDAAGLNASIVDLQEGKANQSDFDPVKQKVRVDITESASPTLSLSSAIALSIRAGNYPWAPTSFRGWFYGFQVDEPTRLDSIVPLIKVVSTTVTLEMKLWRRALSDAASTATPGTLSSDDLVYSRSVAAGEFAAAIDNFAFVELSIADAGMVYPGYIYVFELNGRTVNNNFSEIANGGLAFSGTHQTWERGWYRNAAGAVSALTDANALRLVWRLIKLEARQLNVAQGKIGAVFDLLQPRDDVMAMDTGFASRYSISDGFRGVQTGILFENDTVATRAVLPFIVASDAAFINTRIYLRNNQASTAAFGDDADDLVVYESIDTMADVGLPVNTAGFITVDLSSAPVLQAGMMYGIEFTPRTSSLSLTTMAMGRATYLATDPQWRKGWFTQASPPAWTAFSSTSGLSIQVQKIGLDGVLASSCALTPAIRSPERYIRSSSSFSVTVHAATLRRPSGDQPVPATTVSFDAPASMVRTGTLSLAALPSVEIVPVLPSGDQYISDVTLTRISDATVLVPGTDYVIRADQGAVGLPSAGTPISVSYTITGHAQRYDIVSYNPTTKAVVVTKGTDRYTSDAEYYRASLPAGNIALYAAFVTWHGVELIPVMHHKGRLRDDRLAEVANWRNYCRACLPNTMKALRTGSALKLIGYGDSITAIGSGQFAANGAVRDLVAWLSRMPADTKAMFPTFDGDAGANAHVHISWNWVLKAAFEARFASAVSYLNYGWAGTTSGNNNPDASHYGGLWPARLAPVLAEGPGLMILAFGMNELGDANTYANIVNIIGQAKVVGQEVIVITPPRCNEISRSSVYDAWRKTHDDLVLAALDTGSAYVSTFELDGKGFEGAVARSPQSMCTMNLYNHPWPYELADIGKWMASIFD